MGAHEDAECDRTERRRPPALEALARVAFGAAATGMLVIVTFATVPREQLDLPLKLAVGQAAWVIAAFLSAWFIIQSDVPLLRSDGASVFWRLVVGVLALIGGANLNDVFGSLLLHFQIEGWKVEMAKMLIAASGMIYVCSPRIRLNGGYDAGAARDGG